LLCIYINSGVLNRGCNEVGLRLSEYIISVSKRHKNNHAGVKNGTWSIYYYDEEGKIQTKRINPLLIWYYKLRKRQRTKAVCSNCSKQFLILSCWYDKIKDANCPICLDEEEEDNITVDENENEDSLGKIVSSALIGLVAMKFRP